ncbi:MAG TPA: hypothetical protein VE669_07280, partial [Actinomycetota bacterium]|nr:hypothetical protein [Actinomycetota bacterium]
LARQTDLLAEGHGLDAVRAWEGRGRARLLVDPGALGKLRWLLLATRGLPAPGWLDRAREHVTGGDRPAHEAGGD